MSELYRYVDSWDGERLFIYVVVIILIIWLFTKCDMGINILIGLIVAIFVISYLNNRFITTTSTLEELQTIKKNIIKPKLNDDAQEQMPIVDFTFSIQDLYAYNPLAYEEMIKNINQFYDKYAVCFADTSTCDINYGLMEQYKRDAMNALMSMIYTLPDDPKVRNLVDTAASVLDGIMTKHLDQISYLIDERVYKYGYSTDSKIINYGPKAFNEYDDIFNIYSYEIY